MHDHIMIEYVNFSSRMPRAVLNALDAESARQRRSRNQMILEILLERYQITLTNPLNRRTRASPKRKPKQKAAVN